MRGHAGKTRSLIVLALAGASLILTMQNCGNVSFESSAGNLESSSTGLSVPDPDPTPTPALPEKKALVYGSDAQDRQLLAQKIAGSTPPTMGEIFNNWRRVSGGTVYQNGAAVIPEPAYASCFTGLNASGSWNPMPDPARPGKTIDPGGAAACVDSVSFAASSWSYLSGPGRLHNATNANPFNGFVSTLKFDRYIHEAVLTSTVTDDDAIGLIVAFAVDGTGTVHTLSALRTQGGVVPVKGWALVYRKNNSVVKIIGEKAVGGTNCMNGPACQDVPKGDGGDGKGWSGRMSRVHVERQGNRIIALTGPWALSEAAVLDNGSRIEIDLNDPGLGLGIFKGAQSYGYGIQSQASSEFRAISFNALNDEEFVYDLKNDLVYQQNGTGGYVLVPGAKAFVKLGYPSLVGNVETQKLFRLNQNYTFDLMP